MTLHSVTHDPDVNRWSSSERSERVETPQPANVLFLHGAGVDHREPEACFEPFFDDLPYRRTYVDLPGMGQSPADGLASAADVLEVLAPLLDEPTFVVGHSAGAHYARALAARNPCSVHGLALICPLLPNTRDVPPHRPVIASDLGDDEFRGYFVEQTPEMLERYKQHVAPGAALTDWAALERIGADWDLPLPSSYDGPTLIVAGRLDSTVGWKAAADLVDEYPRSTFALIDDAGHALPHERPDLLGVLVREWLSRS